MNEETTMPAAEETAAEAQEDWSGAFDSGWDDDPVPVTEAEAEEGAEPETDGAGETEGADQQAEGEPEGERDGGEEAPESAGQGEASESPDQGEAFTLRHLGEERTVTRDEVVTLAQKGMDYDRIREKWDSVKDDVPKLRMYESFLQELAEARGGDIEGLIDETRTRTLIARAKAEGRDPDPAAAAAEAVRIRMQGAGGNVRGGEQKAAGEKAPEDPQAKTQEMIDRFIRLYGASVKGGDIPPEVWDEASRTGDLVGAWQKHVSGKQDEEIKRLKSELEQAKQQKKNRERSTGSARSEGASASRDPFDEGWDTPV